MLCNIIFGGLLIVGIVQGVVVPVNNRQCPSDSDVMVPSRFVMEESSRYTYKEAGLQVYTELRIPCDGFVTEWRFIANNPLVYGLHIGIFRPVPGCASSVQLIDQSYLQALTTPNGAGGVWIYYPLDPPIQVKTGDFIGIFYDRFRTVHDLLTIPSKIVQNPDANTPPTYVFVMDDSDMKQNDTLELIKAERIFRKPALMAIISGMTTTTTVSTTEATTTTSRPKKTTTTPKKKSTTTRMHQSLMPEDGAFSIIVPVEETEPTAVTDGYFSQTTPASVFTRCTAPPTALQVCKRLQIRAYYDYERSQCRPFFGCESWSNNANNFNSVDECQAFCFSVTAKPPSVDGNNGQSTPATMSSECYSTPSASTYCYNPGMRYYFDRERKTCASFYGCPLTTNPSANNFDTLNACQRKCKNTVTGIYKAAIRYQSNARFLVPRAVNPMRMSGLNKK